jgi:hypothetical protein
MCDFKFPFAFLERLSKFASHFGRKWPKAGVAQLVEHDLAKVGVASSSLVSRSQTPLLKRGALFLMRFYNPPGWWNW